MSHEDERSKRLIKYGFIKDSAWHKYTYDKDKEQYVPKEDYEYNPKDAFEEHHEEAPVMPGFMGEGKYYRTGYPDTPKKFRLALNSPGASLEETYYSLIEILKNDWGFPKFDKITDVFSASEQSSFWGQAQQRIGMQQDKANSYMASIGKMVKDLFQLVRELRIIEERLDIYKKAPDSKSADITLKGMYIDMVEGGSKNPSSVYGIAQQVGFTTLPDLFFNTKVYDKTKVDNIVDNMNWNQQVKNVLKRKLYAFINWKEKTEEEMKNRFQFTLRYLRQHWGTIRMYMNWVKPYLKNIERMKMSEEHRGSHELISAFETSITEIEVLAKKPKNEKDAHPCILISMEYTTQPQMSYRQEGPRQRGPLHVGEVEFQLRGYGWTEEQIENFKRMKQDEEMDLIKMIDDSIKSAMDALGDDLRRYLEKADQKLEKFDIKSKEEDKEEREKKQNMDLFEPFKALFGSFKSVGKAFSGFGSLVKSKEGNSKPSLHKQNIEVVGDDNIREAIYQTYKAYKKEHGMIHW